MDKKTNNTETDKKYTYEDFLDIIARLRAPGGCPWDQKQTHESLRGLPFGRISGSPGCYRQ